MNTFPEQGQFQGRHIGPSEAAQRAMLETLGLASLEELISQVVPREIRNGAALALPEPRAEWEALRDLRAMASNNQVWRSFIGQGYYDCILPPVIQRNVLENPGWYTAYTPYQAEISQGRLEALLNFQTLITELTGLAVANASLLDEATAAAEAMAMAHSITRGSRFLVSEGCFPQTIDVLRTRAEPLGIELVVTDLATADFAGEDGTLIGALLQFPNAAGEIFDPSAIVQKIHAAKGLVVVAADLLALTLLKPPGSWGADIAVGSAQRFGVPMGFGGPHAAYMACSEAHVRRLPGRLAGVSQDAEGRPALRLTLQTREQHIRREKATSNICTAQVLLAVIAGFYAVYHGPEGLRQIARTVASATSRLAQALRQAGFTLVAEHFFDTLTLRVSDAPKWIEHAAQHRVNLGFDPQNPGLLSISLDEASVFSGEWKVLGKIFGLEPLEDPGSSTSLPETWLREDDFLRQKVFHSHRTESRMLRYLRRLEGKDIALNWSMIPLGSCTMKLNAASEMLPLSWPEFSSIHPFVPAEQASGYFQMAAELERWLAEITGFDAVSLQPNAGSQGEFAGLLAIRRYHLSRSDRHRNICLIPVSAHGTNPASAVMAGMKVVPIKCDEKGNIDTADLREKAEAHRDSLAALMVTYPSTHGVFEESIREICEITHACGGQVYMDGANMNAQVGLCSPGGIGADVCHLNLHKTFCIPHGGGGPGVGPIGVAGHLRPFLPGHRRGSGGDPAGAVCAAPLGSASILTISWMYIAMMGSAGLTQASRVAILNANYIARRLEKDFPVLYRGQRGWVAHECIIDLRPFKESAGIEVEDVAKRLIDFGFHAPTMSWPVPGTLMIEPTESEDKEELDRFCDAMIAIRNEIELVASGRWDAKDNPLKRAPHPAANVIRSAWPHSYSPETAAFPAEWVKDRKYWPPVSRIDNLHGDRHLVCTCSGMEEHSS